MNNKGDIDIILNKNDDININNLDKYISFLKSYLKIDILELRYIIKQSLVDNNKLINKQNVTKDDFINIFMSKYYKNITILKKYIKINKYNFNKLINKLNQIKNKAHFYFEDIDKNIPYYIEIINYLENTSNILL